MKAALNGLPPARAEQVWHEGRIMLAIGNLISWPKTLHGVLGGSMPLGCRGAGFDSGRCHFRARPIL